MLIFDPMKEIIESYSESIPRICFLGLGTAASKSVEEMAHSSQHENIAYMAIDISQSDKASLTPDASLPTNLNAILINQNDLDTASVHPHDPEKFENNKNDKEVQSVLNNVSVEFEKFEAVFVIANLGRKSGSTLVSLMGRIASSCQTPFYGIMSLPLALEGSARKKLASMALNDSSTSFRQIAIIPSQTCFQSMNPRPKHPGDFYPEILKRHAIIHEMIAELLGEPNFLPVSFSEFESVLICGGLAHPLLATFRCSGETGFSDVLQSIKSSPQISNWNSHFDASDIFLFCNALNELSCEQIDLLVETVDKLFPESHVLVGATCRDLPSIETNQMDVTLLAVQNCSVQSRHGENQQHSSSRTSIDNCPISISSSPSHVAHPDDDLHPDLELDGHKEFVPTFSEISIITPLESKPDNSRMAQIPNPDFSKIDHQSYIAPAPELNADLKDEILKRKKRSGRKKEARKIEQMQEQLPLAIISRGRFEGTEESIYSGQDLDIPTFIRKGIDIR